jgi:protein involved in polysaccharide export with SLBB domain
VSWLDGLPVWRARPTKGRWRSPYQIAAGDLLLVWTARSTLGLFEVQWDGTLDIDGIRLPVAGYDLNDAQLQLSARLRDPVSAVVVAYGDRSWILLGSAVRRSGRKPLPGADADLAESVALAGGLRRPEKKAIIKRGAEFVDADLDGPTGRSWRLLPGDIVVIGPKAGSGPTSPAR